MTSGKDDDLSVLSARLGIDFAAYQQFPRALRFNQTTALQYTTTPSPLTVEQIDAPCPQASPVGTSQLETIHRGTPASAVEQLRIINRSAQQQHAHASTGLAKSLKNFMEERPAGWKPSATPRVLPVFSTAGGVGTTTILATVGRILALSGETVVLMDDSDSLLPLYFGGEISHQQRVSFPSPSKAGSFDRSPGSAASPGAIHILGAIPHDAAASSSPENLDAVVDSLTSELMQYSARSACILADVPHQTPWAVQRRLLAAGNALVVLTPDLRSVIALGRMLRRFDQMRAENGDQISVYCLLNQFDPSVESHVEIQRQLRGQLRGSLLPFVIQRNDEFAAALAQGTTIAEHPGTARNESVLTALATWMKCLLHEVRSGAKKEQFATRGFSDPADVSVKE